MRRAIRRLVEVGDAPVRALAYDGVTGTYAQVGVPYFFTALSPFCVEWRAAERED
ncbi:hypothetical protein ACFZCU_14280 [Streptomyces canus]|uniref:hypothetical protein n=1 Tax=Streptomyces canus TaxID=58343 RepID=UPI0036ECEBE0